MSTKNIIEACEYLRKHPVLHRIMKAWLGKYRSLGNVGGSVRLSGLTADDRQTIEGLLGKNLGGKKEYNLTIKVFVNALNNSRFAPCDPIELLTQYFRQVPIADKDLRAQEREREIRFFDDLLQTVDGTPAADWLRYVLDNNQAPYSVMRSAYKEDEEQAGREFGFVLAALNKLPQRQGRLERMAAFAANITGDAHFFDENRSAFSYLCYGICYFYDLDVKNKNTVEGKVQILYRAGLAKTTLTNTVLTVGIGARTHTGIYTAGAAFAADMEPLVLTLENMKNWTDVIIDGKIVYAVENPTVLAELLDKRSDERFALVCVNGQPTYAVTLLLDFIVAAGKTIYYSGDFDPEGIMIADRLKTKYGEHLKLWRFTEEDYQRCEPSVEIDERRLKQLGAVADAELRQLAEVLYSHKKAGYQELLAEEYWQDIREKLMSIEQLPKYYGR